MHDEGTGGEHEALRPMLTVGVAVALVGVLEFVRMVMSRHVRALHTIPREGCRYTWTHLNSLHVQQILQMRMLFSLQCGTPTSLDPSNSELY